MNLFLMAVVVAAALAGLFQLRKKSVRSGVALIAISCLAIAAHGAIDSSHATKDIASTLVFGLVGLLLTVVLVVLYLAEKKRL